MTVKLLALLRPSRGSDSVRRARVGVPGCRSCRCRSVESNRLKSEDGGGTRVFRGVFPGVPSRRLRGIFAGEASPLPADRGKQHVIQLTAINGVSPAASRRFTIQIT